MKLMFVARVAFELHQVTLQTKGRLLGHLTEMSEKSLLVNKRSRALREEVLGTFPFLPLAPLMDPLSDGGPRSPQEERWRERCGTESGFRRPREISASKQSGQHAGKASVFYPAGTRLTLVRMRR